MSYRTDRTASEIQKCVSVIIQNKLRNPEVSPMTTVTGVTVSKDLKYATVYVSVIGDAKEGGTVAALNASAGFIRREIAGALRDMRAIPSLIFKEDSSIAYGRKIDSILKEIAENESHTERD